MSEAARSRKRQRSSQQDIVRHGTTRSGENQHPPSTSTASTASTSLTTQHHSPGLTHSSFTPALPPSTDRHRSSPSHDNTVTVGRRSDGSRSNMDLFSDYRSSITVNPALFFHSSASTSVSTSPSSSSSSPCHPQAASMSSTSPRGCSNSPSPFLDDGSRPSTASSSFYHNGMLQQDYRMPLINPGTMGVVPVPATLSRSDLSQLDEWVLPSPLGTVSASQLSLMGSTHSRENAHRSSQLSSGLPAFSYSPSVDPSLVPTTNYAFDPHHQSFQNQSIHQYQHNQQYLRPSPSSSVSPIPSAHSSQTAASPLLYPSYSSDGPSSLHYEGGLGGSQLLGSHIDPRFTSLRRAPPPRPATATGVQHRTTSSSTPTSTQMLSSSPTTELTLDGLGQQLPPYGPPSSSTPPVHLNASTSAPLPHLRPADFASARRPSLPTHSTSQTNSLHSLPLSASRSTGSPSGYSGASRFNPSFGVDPTRQPAPSRNVYNHSSTSKTSSSRRLGTTTSQNVKGLYNKEAVDQGFPGEWGDGEPFD